MEGLTPQYWSATDEPNSVSENSNADQRANALDRFIMPPTAASFSMKGDEFFDDFVHREEGLSPSSRKASRHWQRDRRSSPLSSLSSVKAGSLSFSLHDENHSFQKESEAKGLHAPLLMLAEAAEERLGGERPSSPPSPSSWSKGKGRRVVEPALFMDSANLAPSNAPVVATSSEAQLPFLAPQTRPSFSQTPLLSKEHYSYAGPSEPSSHNFMLPRNYLPFSLDAGVFAYRNRLPVDTRLLGLESLQPRLSPQKASEKVVDEGTLLKRIDDAERSARKHQRARRLMSRLSTWASVCTLRDQAFCDNSSLVTGSWLKTTKPSITKLRSILEELQQAHILRSNFETIQYYLDAYRDDISRLLDRNPPADAHAAYDEVNQWLESASSQRKTQLSLTQSNYCLDRMHTLLQAIGVQTPQHGCRPEWNAQKCLSQALEHLKTAQAKQWEATQAGGSGSAAERYCAWEYVRLRTNLYMREVEGLLRDDEEEAAWYRRLHHDHAVGVQGTGPLGKVGSWFGKAAAKAVTGYIDVALLGYTHKHTSSFSMEQPGKADPGGTLCDTTWSPVGAVPFLGVLTSLEALNTFITEKDALHDCFVDAIGGSRMIEELILGWGNEVKYFVNYLHMEGIHNRCPAVIATRGNVVFQWRGTKWEVDHAARFLSIFALVQEEIELLGSFVVSCSNKGVVSDGIGHMKAEGSFNREATSSDKDQEMPKKRQRVEGSIRARKASKRRENVSSEVLRLYNNLDVFSQSFVDRDQIEMLQQDGRLPLKVLRPLDTQVRCSDQLVVNFLFVRFYLRQYDHKLQQLTHPSHPDAKENETDLAAIQRWVDDRTSVSNLAKSTQCVEKLKRLLSLAHSKVFRWDARAYVLLALDCAKEALKRQEGSYLPLGMAFDAEPKRGRGGKNSKNHVSERCKSKHNHKPLCQLLRKLQQLADDLDREDALHVGCGCDTYYIRSEEGGGGGSDDGGRVRVVGETLYPPAARELFDAFAVKPYKAMWMTFEALRGTAGPKAPCVHTKIVQVMMAQTSLANINAYVRANEGKRMPWGGGADEEVVALYDELSQGADNGIEYYFNCARCLHNSYFGAWLMAKQGEKVFYYDDHRWWPYASSALVHVEALSREALFEAAGNLVYHAIPYESIIRDGPV